MIVSVAMDGNAPPLRDRKRRAMMLRVQDEAFDAAFRTGYAGTTVEGIAAAADVSPSTVYRAFGTKEGIFLWDELELPTMQLLRRELANHAPVAAAIAVVEAMGALESHIPAAEMRERLRLVLTEPDLRSSLNDEFRRFEGELAALFSLGGEIDVVEARIVAAATVAALLAAVEGWESADPAVPFAVAASAAAASLRNVLNG
jgi:AcrR family transcriptional regulator